MAKPVQWIAFRSFFDQAEMAGIDLAAVAESLLAVLKSPHSGITARGIAREWDIRDGLEVERLPRKPSPVRVPASFWSPFTGVTGECESRWVDEREKEGRMPYQWGHIDWIASTACDAGFHFPRGHLEFFRREFALLEIEANDARAVIRSAVEPAQARPATPEREQFMKECIAQDLGQDASLRKWSDLHPNDAKRPAWRAEYNALRLKMGKPSKLGRPRKYAKQ